MAGTLTTINLHNHDITKITVSTENKGTPTQYHSLGLTARGTLEFSYSSLILLMDDVSTLLEIESAIRRWREERETEQERRAEKMCGDENIITDYLREKGRI
jgi:hypothetical protein